METEEQICPHCGGTGIFISRSGSEEETEQKCVCQEQTDEDDNSAIEEDIDEELEINLDPIIG